MSLRSDMFTKLESLVQSNKISSQEQEDSKHTLELKYIYIKTNKVKKSKSLQFDLVGVYTFHVQRYRIP